MKFYQSGGNYFYKQYKNGKKKRISLKEYKTKEGGGIYNIDMFINVINNNAEDINFIENINENINKYVYIGQNDGIIESNDALLTSGVGPCIGIGTTIDNINYFSHTSTHGDKSDDIYPYDNKKWCELLEKNKDKINKIYIFGLNSNIGYKLGEDLIVFLKKINKIGMLDKIIFVKLEKLTMGINGDVIFTNPADDKYLFGIHNGGQIGGYI
jgi:hypothetical protein